MSNWARHPILCLYRGPETPWCRFFDELLIQEGYLSFDSFELDSLVDLEQALDGRALLVLGASELHAREIELIRKFIRGGGKAILLRPIAQLVEALDLPVEEKPGGSYGVGNCYSVAPPGYLELGEHPWAGHHAGVWLQCHAHTSLWKIRGASSIAQYGSQRGAPSTYSAIIEQECGEGHLTIFWFDPGTTLVLMRQGDPRLASTGHSPDADADGMHKSPGLFYGHLDYQLRLIPQADILADLVVGIIRGMTDSSLPLARLWHLPQNATALTLVDGDSDGFHWNYYDALVAPLQEAGIPFSLNLHPDDFSKMDRAASRRIFDAGNDLELHYWVGTQLGTIEDAAKNIPVQHRVFKEITGGIGSVGSRGHSFVWPGYTEVAEILSKEGFRLETSFASFRGYQSGYVNGSGRAARFMTLEGRFLEISQQSTIFMDDIVFSSKSLLPPLTPDAAYKQLVRFYDDAATRYHGVITTSLHPGQYTPKSYGDGMTAIRQAILDSTKKHRLPALTVRAWAGFQEARRLVDLSWNGKAWRVQTKSPIPGLTCHLPSESGETQRQGLSWKAVTKDYACGESSAPFA